tara:strand:- start:1679 stop:2182 length:504 start_codon:yes stop_codon:yes gene_type:complete
MFLSGELNVPGAAGNIQKKISPATAFQPNMNTTGAPVGYTQQATGFMNLPGAVGNMGAIAEAPAVRRDMQGTELVPDPRNPGKFIHPNILQNPGYEQRYRDASQKWQQDANSKQQEWRNNLGRENMRKELDSNINNHLQQLQNRTGGFGGGSFGSQVPALMEHLLQQ